MTEDLPHHGSIPAIESKKNQSSISTDDVFRAVLAMDVYNRGYNGGLALNPSGSIGNAIIGQSSLDKNLIGFGGTSNDHKAIGFYALEYDWNGQTVISFRGTDDDFASGSTSDLVNGFGIAARIANRSDIAKLEKMKTQLRRERDIRRTEVVTGRQQSADKLKRIHASQNRLDEQRCKTYRDSDTRDYRDRRDRWDMGKLKPPMFGNVIAARYDVEEAQSPAQRRNDRRRMTEPLEFKPVRPEPQLPTEPTRSDTPYVKRDPKRHAEEIAKRARDRAIVRSAAQSQQKSRKSGRKRRPRPR